MQSNGTAQPPSSALRVFSLLRRRRSTAVLLLGLILATSSLDIAIPFFTQHLIDGIVRAVSGVGAFAVSMLFSSLAAIFVSVATARALRSFYNYRLFKTIAAIEDQIKSAAFENFLNWDMAALTSTNSGQIIGNWTVAELRYLSSSTRYSVKIWYRPSSCSWVFSHLCSLRVGSSHLPFSYLFRSIC